MLQETFFDFIAVNMQLKLAFAPISSWNNEISEKFFPPYIFQRVSKKQRC